MNKSRRKKLKDLALKDKEGYYTIIIGRGTPYLLLLYSTIFERVNELPKVKVLGFY